METRFGFQQREGGGVENREILARDKIADDSFLLAHAKRLSQPVTDGASFAAGTVTVNDFHDAHALLFRAPDLGNHQSPRFVNGWKPGFHVVYANRTHARQHPPPAQAARQLRSFVVYWVMGNGVSEVADWSFKIGLPLALALVLLLMRVFVMGRAQEKRQRANRQQTERLKSLVSAYRSLAGSFRPLSKGELIESGDHGAMEAALSDILLFGSATQVDMAAECARALVNGDVPPLEPLVTDLRRDLRMQLGLAPLDAALELPAPGPSRGGRSERKNGEAGNGTMAGRGGAGAGGGVGGGMLLGSGASAGVYAEGGSERTH